MCLLYPKNGKEPIMVLLESGLIRLKKSKKSAKYR